MKRRKLEVWVPRIGVGFVLSALVLSSIILTGGIVAGGLILIMKFMEMM